ncbi:tRNA threonylcarbamoyladenosine biosynthesis protein TsaE [Chitinivorax tropicus]|uniref:tRNA threonylcarbamoyladenosine biosynthesis protein TsaE n=1 Tax=Chitinivorax tropicus TaxID=714531 RepID=A0A840MHN4_9PROT|nr:tRNA (adenosine(37)-N6)-threonylcarbamoyltransferase complex ATPase subunit type 1 TsaE [Chitinivorax tropicus]MBB5018158.1 tRNA threonylcarbamoyladenosine biosynthesis protein TsaE [Chitinivorax tropicus]
MSTLPQAHSSSTCYLADESSTLRCGQQFASALQPGLVIYLQGDLGAGKTTFSRGLLRGLGFQGKVKSPTYTLVEPYVTSSLYLYHFDLYRFNDPLEWEDAGFREYFNAESICLVEWPDKASGLLPTPDLAIYLDLADTGRHIRIDALTERGHQCLSRFTPPN